MFLNENLNQKTIDYSCKEKMLQSLLSLFIMIKKLMIFFDKSFCSLTS